MKRILLPLLFTFVASVASAKGRHGITAAGWAYLAQPAPKWYVARVVGHVGTSRAAVNVLYGPFRSTQPADALCARAINAAWQCNVEPLNPPTKFPPAVRP